MFVIIEANGGKIMGIMFEENQDEYLTFETREEAEKYAEENCVFEKTVVEVCV